MSMCTWTGYGKNGSLGAKDEKWSGDYLDVEDGVLIPWLKTDRKMDTRSFRNGVGKFGKKDYI
jgi:hypothetical protein